MQVPAIVASDIGDDLSSSDASDTSRIVDCINRAKDIMNNHNCYISIPYLNLYQPRGIFLHQLYDMFGDVREKTRVDKSIQYLREKGFIITIDCSFYMSAGLYIMTMDDFVTDLKRFEDFEDNKNYKLFMKCVNSFKLLLTCERFRSRMSFIKHEISMSDTLSKDSDVGISENLLDDEQVETLLSINFLRCDSVTSNVLWISHPCLSVIGPWLVNGNKEIISIIQKKKYREIKEKDLFYVKDLKDMKPRQIKSSKLPIAYHIYDMIGRGILVGVSNNTCNFDKKIFRLC